MQQGAVQSSLSLWGGVSAGTATNRPKVHRAMGFLHLCQPDPGKSCAACCGIYNYADSTPEALTARLRRRTAMFRSIVHGRGDLATYSRAIKGSEEQAKRYEVIYCCEYAGFIDPEERRVGCLLHPCLNGNEDLRDVSFYGRQLCNDHFCPSYHYISRAEQQALLHIFDDWYLYGLCLTDIDLVKTYFQLIGNAVGEMPDPALFRKDPIRRVAGDFFLMKLSWPFRSPDVNRFGKYYFDGSQYMIHHIDYDALGCDRSVFDRIFLSLSSIFASADVLRQAEAIIRNHIETFVRAFHSMH
jgi:hypothetical protein